ncbi:MAG: polysaccharide deacetylase family protein [Chloroflexi bacterium]|nr:polysaccharide deacetylase family protein [Chloroflexota bacterium]
MPTERTYGMDHPHYAWSPIVDRPALRWPNDARMALCVILNLDHVEWVAPEGSYGPSVPAGGLGRITFPEYAQLSHREYGHRVGIFRVLDVLERHGIRPTVAMDALTAEHYPYLVRHCLGRGCEIIGHGISASRMITSNMSEQEEREYIRTSMDALSLATGAAPVGWLGPEYGESARTPQLLADAGIRYVCDWTNDEQPYPMTTSAGNLTALPIMWELDDVIAMWDRKIPFYTYAKSIKDSFVTMHGDAAESGRLMVLNLHPWLIGQPYRIGSLDDALGEVMKMDGVWAASGSEITDWFTANRPDS